ncbi:hypothetical protein VNO77_35980 [Canavalia gladiata]|uniref:RING-type domain-containing protein n=1 Tax=Canavalia gladiata TaxID=3824 RepID=A0AAN9PVF3_CANGL
MAVHRHAVALWSILFITFVICSVALITMDYTSPGFFIFLGCIFGFILWSWTNKFMLDQGRGYLHRNERESGSAGIGNIESEATQSSLPEATAPFMIERIRNEREQHWQRWQDIQLVAFASGAHIARLAIRALPPVRIFNGDEPSDCPICIEEFKTGELIQPFGACVHQFHSSCLNSWLLGGKITCPVCRTELSSNH